MNRLNFATILPVTALLILSSAPAAFSQNVTDHPLVSRFKGSEIVQADSKVLEFDEYPLIVGPLKNGQFPVRKIEGKISHIHYVNPQGRSTLEIFRAYQGALTQAGFATLFSCSDQECGDPTNDGRYGRWMGYWCEGNPIQCEEPMRYIAAKLSRPAGDVYVAIQVKTNGTNAEDGTYVNVIEQKPMDSGLVSASAAAPAAPSTNAPSADNGALRAPDRPAPAAYSIPATHPTTAVVSKVVPAGTVIPVRMIDSIDSSTGRVGQKFRASVAEDVAANGVVIIPKGSDVLMTLLQDEQAGRIAGRSMVRVGLVSVNVNGREIPLVSSEYSQKGASKTKRSLLSGVAGAGLGAAMGGIFGGTSGALTGAGAGTAAGIGAQAILSGPKVRIPTETVLLFTLEAAATVR